MNLFLLFLVTCVIAAYLVDRFVLKKNKPKAVPATPIHTKPISQQPKNDVNPESHIKNPTSASRSAMAGSIATVIIIYRDANNNESSRAISVRSVSDWFYDNDTAMESFCHMRQGPRTFLVSRVQQMIDPYSGEIIASPKEWLFDRYQESPGGRREMALSECSNELAVIVYVARADGRMMPAERRIIVNYMLQRCPELKLDPDFVEEAVRGIESREWHFNKAVAALKSKPEGTRRLVIDAARDIVLSEKTVHPAEQAALSKLSSEMGMPISDQVLTHKLERQ